MCHMTQLREDLEGLPSLCRCIWGLGSEMLNRTGGICGVLLTLALCVTSYQPLNSALITSDIWTLWYLLLTPALCIIYYKFMHRALLLTHAHTTDLYILCYLLLTPKLCFIYYWPLNCKVLTPDPCTQCYYLLLNSVLLTTDLCILHHLLLTSELYITYFWTLLYLLPNLAL